MKDYQIDISFIIPAFNAKKTINSTVESLVSDIRLSNIVSEILIVENGSTDGTYEYLMNKYKENEIIKIYSSKKGVSCARNCGINNSNGEKIIFVDADDEWLKGSIDNLMRKESYKNDLLICNYIKANKVIRISDSFEFEESEITKIRTWMLQSPTTRMTVWGKVFKSCLMKKNNIYFDENLSYSEDSEFLVRYTQICKSISCIDEPVYKYILTENSAVRSFSKDRTNLYIQALEKVQSNLELEGNTLLLNVTPEYILIHLNLILVHEIFTNNLKLKFKSKLDLMKKTKNILIFKNALKSVELKKCLRTQLLPEFFMKLHFDFLCAVICQIKVYINLRMKEMSK